jgi:hypothetical protein
MASHDEIVMRGEGISGALKAMDECIRGGLKSKPEQKRGWRTDGCWDKEQ